MKNRDLFISKDLVIAPPGLNNFNIIRILSTKIILEMIEKQSQFSIF